MMATRSIVLCVFVVFALLNLGEAATFTIYEDNDLNRTSTVAVLARQEFTVRLPEKSIYYYWLTSNATEDELKYNKKWKQGKFANGFRNFVMSATGNDRMPETRLSVAFELYWWWGTKPYTDYRKELTIVVLQQWVTKIDLDDPDNDKRIFTLPQGEVVALSVRTLSDKCAWKAGNGVSAQGDVEVKGAVNAEDWFTQEPIVPGASGTGSRKSNFRDTATLTPMGIGKRDLTFRCQAYAGGKLSDVDSRRLSIESVLA